jgi:hypothetical protein
MFIKLSPIRQKIAEFVGVSEGFVLNKAMKRSRRPQLTGDENNLALVQAYDTKDRCAKRFYVALMLSDLISEESIWNVSKK